MEGEGMTSLDRRATDLTGIPVVEAGMRAKGQRVLSLDHAFEDGVTLWDLVAEHPDAEPAAYDRDVRDIGELCDLSPLETRLAQYIWDGEHYGTGPSDKLCQLMYPDAPYETVKDRNRVKSRVKSVYAGMREKLAAEWAADEPEPVKKRLRSSDEDSRRLVIGRHREWWPPIEKPIDFSVHIRYVAR